MRVAISARAARFHLPTRSMMPAMPHIAGDSAPRFEESNAPDRVHGVRQTVAFGRFGPWRRVQLQECWGARVPDAVDWGGVLLYFSVGSTMRTPVAVSLLSLGAL